MGKKKSRIEAEKRTSDENALNSISIEEAGDWGYFCSSFMRGVLIDFFFISSLSLKRDDRTLVTAVAVAKGGPSRLGGRKPRGREPRAL